MFTMNLLTYHHCFIVFHGVMPLIGYGDLMMNGAWAIKEWTLPQERWWCTRQEISLAYNFF
jgi:hypothetical protein